MLCRLLFDKGRFLRSILYYFILGDTEQSKSVKWVVFTEVKKAFYDKTLWFSCGPSKVYEWLCLVIGLQ